MANCEAQCIREYTDGQLQVPTAPPDAVNAPFVIAEFFDEGNIITVGNDSSPKTPNTAAIISFQYGRTNGTGVQIEIIDEEGGDFEHFFKKLSSTISTAKQYHVRVRWGWIGANCLGPGGVSSQSQWHYIQLLKFSIKYEAKIKFTLEGTDPMNQIMQVRVDKTYGEDGAPMKLKDAIRQLCKDNPIPIPNVRFLRKEASGEVSSSEWEFKNDPKGKWETSGQHVLQTITRWVQSHPTDRDKGIIPAWDDTEKTYTLVLWEDPAPNNNQSDEEDKPLRGYVVNGGDCSNVISFTTSITGTVLTPISGSGGGVDPNTGVSHTQAEGGDVQKNIGTTTTLQIPETARNAYGTDAATETIKAGKKQEKASIYFSTVADIITAELRIMGDPTFDLGTYLINKKVGIAVVNPFNIVPFGDRLEWKVSGGSGLAESSCNKVLSHKSWMVTGFNHDIRDGSYTTTLNVKQLVVQNFNGISLEE